MAKSFLRHLGLDGELSREKIINFLSKNKIVPYYDSSYCKVLFRHLDANSIKIGKSFARECVSILGLRTKVDCDKVRKEVQLY